MAVTLYGWGAMFDLPTPSPFVAKADIQMQMLGLTFDRAIADLESVAKHKAPYVRDNGVLIEDSTFIRWHFEKALGIDLDKGLTAEQRATAWAFERMLENRMVPVAAGERWLVDANFDKGPRQFFMSVPEAMREQVMTKVRGDFSAAMYGAGFTRFSREERMQLMDADLTACAVLLGEKPYMFGSQPVGADATFYGVLSACATRFFEGPLPALVEKHANLMGYITRMEQRFFPADRWPKMG